MSTYARALAERLGGKAHPVTLRAVAGICECPHCGLIQRRPQLQPGCTASCVRCHTRLGRTRTNPPIATPLAFCVTSLVLFIISVTQPLMSIDVYGRTRSVTLFTGPIELMREGWVAAGLLVGMVTTLMPGLEIVLMLGILLGALHHRLPWRVPQMMRRYDRLRPWAMIEVYLLGLLVAYSKLVQLAGITVDPAAYALFGLTLTMAATDSTLNDDVIWSRRRVRLVHRQFIPATRDADADHGQGHSRPPLDHLVSCRACGLVCYAETPLERERYVGDCPRCGKALRRRKTDSLRRTAILVFCAAVLYIPANVFSIMTTIKVHRGGGHTIVQGIFELYQSGMLPLALLVFFASLTVPILKILSLAVMSFAAWRGSSTRLVDRTRLYRIVDFVGRWSMIDVFMVSILVALVHFGPLANVWANGGMTAFATVVVVTIAAANSFDPRIMWDAAGYNRPLLARPMQYGRARSGAKMGHAKMGDSKAASARA